MDEECRLIINADDFGLNCAVNDAVMALHERGIVTSASLMGAEDAAPEAIEMAREQPSLGVGLHAVLTAGKSALPPAALPHLAPSGRFPPAEPWAGLMITLHPAWRAEMRGELIEQFARFRAADLPLSHVDSHRHFHLTPAVFQELVRLALENGASGIRIPQDDYRLHRTLVPGATAGEAALAVAFGLLCTCQRLILAKSRLIVPARCFGLFRSCRLDLDYLVGLAERLPAGLHELHCHPRFDTERGKAEYSALASDSFRAALERRGVRLCSYRNARAC